ncbi:MAG TPA: alpha/beta hydrolase [Bdellovibrionales bacterium]|nr:alpha/beta hydrolase [Bdellovibrionales bacterium]
MAQNENKIQSWDGETLFIRSWRTAKPVGTIVVTHGLGEHSGSYKYLAEGLKDSGFSLHAWDLRGHGQSGGRRGVLRTWSDYTRDLVEVVDHIKKNELKGEPLILLAHSMGGLVLVKALLDHGDMGARAFALSSPLFGIAVPVPAIKRKGAVVLAKLAPNFTMSNELKYEDLTSDPKVIADHYADKLRHDRTSSVLYLQMVAAMADSLARAGQIKLPALVMQAADDVIVSPKAARQLFDALGSADKKWIEYPGYKHEIFNELNRPAVFADLRAWLSRWTVAQASTAQTHVR